MLTDKQLTEIYDEYYSMPKEKYYNLKDMIFPTILIIAMIYLAGKMFFSYLSN